MKKVILRLKKLLVNGHNQKLVEHVTVKKYDIIKLMEFYENKNSLIATKSSVGNLSSYLQDGKEYNIFIEEIK